MLKSILKISVAIMATGAILNVAGSIPATRKIAEFITKGYGV